ncbi:MAG: hypothetical protein NTZ09_18480 [Candidatus Hydrogenedentes bacterium]|nr:hypothetical protein [Candidatus Hydrogenedentota bacterium]
MARNREEIKPPVDYATVAGALAKSVYEGDIVNFRLLFAPFSPARQLSTELFDMPKYQYLLPDDGVVSEPRYREALDKVNQPEMRAFIQGELEANRPPQLPADLLLMLADNAVRMGKYTSAAQAYESLRIRSRMQQMFLDHANSALDRGDVPAGVRGYIISNGLAYDYAAFPEPLPAIPDFQTRALLLHADYPETPEACIAMADTGPLVQAALEYLLSPDVAGALSERPESLRLEFLAELVRQQDPHWTSFLGRYEEASTLADQFGTRLRATAGSMSLADEIQRELGEDPGRIPATLLGHTIEGGEWWQYLKELAYEHPAAALFVARQAVGDLEIIVPRHRPGSPIARALGIGAGAGVAEAG